MESTLRREEGTSRGIALIGLGGNVPFAPPVGEALFGPALCAAALAALEGEGARVLACSTLRRTPAWPDPTQPAYWNAVARVHLGKRSPEAALSLLLSVEARFGRVRSVRNAPRTLDLDLLDLDGAVRSGPDPVLPHPRMAERAFVLEPLAEIAPDWVHPVFRAAAAQLLAQLD